MGFTDKYVIMINLLIQFLHRKHLKQPALV